MHIISRLILGSVDKEETERVSFPPSVYLKATRPPVVFVVVVVVFVVVG